MPLAAWREIYRGTEVALDPAAFASIDASARAVATILARGEPVYGINTGFGKLASVRIDAADLEQACSAISCCRMPPASASRCRSPSCG